MINKYQLKDRAERKFKCFIIHIMILEKQWDYKIGDIIKTAVIAQTICKALKITDDEFWGSEFPSYKVIQIETISGKTLFGLKIQGSIFNDAYKLGISKNKNIKPKKPNTKLYISKEGLFKSED